MSRLAAALDCCYLQLSGGRPGSLPPSQWPPFLPFLPVNVSYFGPRLSFSPFSNFTRFNTMIIHHLLIHSHITFKLFQVYSSASPVRSHIPLGRSCNHTFAPATVRKLVFNWSFTGCSPFLTGNCGNDNHYSIILSSSKGRGREKPCNSLPYLRCTRSAKKL